MSSTRDRARAHTNSCLPPHTPVWLPDTTSVARVIKTPTSLRMKPVRKRPGRRERNAANNHFHLCGKVGWNGRWVRCDRPATCPRMLRLETGNPVSGTTGKGAGPVESLLQDPNWEKNVLKHKPSWLRAVHGVRTAVHGLSLRKPARNFNRRIQDVMALRVCSCLKSNLRQRVASFRTCHLPEVEEFCESLQSHQAGCRRLGTVRLQLQLFREWPNIPITPVVAEFGFAAASVKCVFRGRRSRARRAQVRKSIHVSAP